MKRNPLINYLREAFLLPSNLGLLTATALATLGVGTLQSFGIDILPWQFPAALGASLELLYLSTVPRLPRFVRAVNAKEFKKLQRVQHRIAALEQLQYLNSAAFQRYQTFHRKKEQVVEELSKSMSYAEVLRDGQLRKLATIDAHYLELLNLQQRHADHLGQEELLKLQLQVEEIGQQVMNASGKTQDLLRKRLELVQKRKAQFLQLNDAAEVAQVQLDTIDDTINYLLEQSLTRHNRAEVNRVIDGIVSDAELHNETVQELTEVYAGLEAQPSDLGFDPLQASRSAS